MADVTFDVFSSKWYEMNPREQLKYCSAYYAWLLLGNRPVISKSADGLSISYGISEVEKLLRYLR